MYSVSAKKQGLLHAHILFWSEEKIRPDQIDSAISVELPDPVEIQVHDIVKTDMIHGPCGTINAVTMHEGGAVY